MHLEEASKAIGAVLRRLGDLRQLWHQTRAAYFEPDKFRLSLQSTIATSRTVTFILQSHKAAIPDFETWYNGFQSAFRADPVMRWAVNARNKVEKQGDLATLSQVKVELVAGYAGHPSTTWVPASMFASLSDIRLTIPAHLLDEHVRKNGVLCVQRRWVDEELPDREILDALAQVYGRLAQMIVDLHSHLGIRVPNGGPDKGEHLLLDVLPDGRLKSMEVLEAERTIYIAVSNGRQMEIGRIPKGEPPKKISRMARKRYGDGGWEKLRDAHSFRDMADVFFVEARRVMLRDGYHVPIMLLWKDLLPLEQIQAWPMDRRAKYMMMRDSAARARQIGANGVTFISEAWTARRKDLPESGFAEEAEQRGEELVLLAANSEGKMFSLHAEVTRKRIRKHKVKTLGPTEVYEGQIMTLTPFLEIWGKLELLFDDEDDAKNA